MSAFIFFSNNIASAQSSNGITPPPSNVIPTPAPFKHAKEPVILSPEVINPELPIREESAKILYDVTSLPKPVKRMRELIMKAAKSGNIENLRALLGSGDNRTQLSYGGDDKNPIKLLHEQSGDKDGQEILAILLEVLEAGYVHLDVGTDHDLYVWPYFYAVQLEKLTPVQRVELFKLVTAGDYEEMLSFGAYIFFRVGITPEGRWIFFVAGD